MYLKVLMKTIRRAHGKQVRLDLRSLSSIKQRVVLVWIQRCL